MGTRTYVAGHRGMVGSALVRRLGARGHTEVVTRTRDELDLTDAGAVDAFFAAERPDQVYLAAATVGGIEANHSRPADFLWDNLIIASNVIKSAHTHDVARLLFLGSSCIYPRLADQPMVEEALLTGTLEPTNEPYAVAKIAGIKLCESFSRQFGRDYRSVMPTNLYGPGDSFHPTHSHVIPGMLRRFHEAVATGADVVTVWGTGTPRREFLHVDDLAAACVHVMQLEHETYWSAVSPMLSHLNVGTGVDLTVAELARLVATVTGFTGEIAFDHARPDGTPRKLLDVSRLARLGWTASIPLEEGLRDAYGWFVAHQAAERVP